MTCEQTYEGWANRETWALALHVNNDQGLQAHVHERIVEEWSAGHLSADQPHRAGDVVRDLFDEWAGQAVEEPAVYGGLVSMLLDIGSLYRVDWTEIGAAFLGDAIEGVEAV